jgi:N-acetylneuraminic acid mutarotase
MKTASRQPRRRLTVDLWGASRALVRGVAAGVLTLSLLHTPDAAHASEAWKWLGGSTGISQRGLYGMKGVAASTNLPGARNGSSAWTNAAGLWLFGGAGFGASGNSGQLNDLWRYDGTNWTWMGGSNVVNRNGIYGTKGLPSPTAVPGGRDGSTVWADGNGVWLFGGLGYGATGTSGRLNDLWRYDATNWTWMAGSNAITQYGIYGARGVGEPSNTPGSRQNGVGWRDSAGGLWLFGGYGYGASGSLGRLNDLWRYDGTNWTWVGGTNIVNRNGVYGTKGVPGTTNTPGAREGCAVWVDGGCVWIFGGLGYGASGGSGRLNDLWRYDGTNWTWVSGSNSVNRSGIYGARAAPTPANVPGGRSGAAARLDAQGRLWLFGGDGYDAYGSSGPLADTWCFDRTHWAWMGGIDRTNQYGAYGTAGVASAGHRPGARFRAADWSDTNGFIFLGGTGRGAVSNGTLNDLWVSQPWPDRRLEIASEHGVAMPAAGAYTNALGIVLTNAVSAVETAGTTQYVCSGWTMEGSSPVAGTGSVLVMTHTNDARLVWTWSTNYYLSLGLTGVGSLDVAGGWQPAGTTVVVTAAPAGHWYVAAWTGDLGGCTVGSNRLTVLLDRPRSVGVELALDGYAMVVTSLYGSCRPPAGTSYFGRGESVTAAADVASIDVGATQYVVTGWAGTGSLTNGTCTDTVFSIESDSTLAWSWQTNYWQSIGVAGGGNVNAGSGWFPAGTTAVLTATAAPGWRFVAWTGSVLSAGNPLAWAPDGPSAVGAVFAQTDVCAVVATCGPNGSVEPDGLVWIPYGASTSFAVTADAHYHIREVFVDGAAWGPLPSWDTGELTTDRTFHAEFAIDTCTLAVASPYGGARPDGVTVHPWNATVVAAVTNSPVIDGGTQYVCSGWVGDGSVANGWGTSVVFSVTNDSRIDWQWRTNHLLDARVAGSGSAGATSGWYAAGSEVVLTAAPAVGWHFVTWTGDTVSPASVLTQSLDRPRSVTAVFEINWYPITATAGPHGAISPSGEVWVAHGGSVAFALAAEASYHVRDIKIDGRSQGAATAWTFSNVTNAHTILAEFAADIDMTAYGDPFLPRRVESLGEPLAGFHIPSTAMWPEGHLLYAEADGSDTAGNRGPFLVYDVWTRQLVYAGNDDMHTGYRCIAVDRSGRAYFSVYTNGLAMYDPALNTAVVINVTLPGLFRAATRPTADGWIYGATDNPERLIRFHPDTLVVEDLGDAGGYTTCMALDPTERYAYYVPDAHGASWRRGTPLIQLDLQTHALKVIAFLNGVYEGVYGYRLGGTYALDISADGSCVFINMNAQNLRDPAQKTPGFGEPCLVVVHIPPAEAAPLQVPALRFEDAAPATGFRAALWGSYIHTASWGDADGDGRPDLLVGTFYQANPLCPVPHRLLLNRGRTFVDARQPLLERWGRGSGSVFADLDNDGDLDLFLCNNTIARRAARDLHRCRGVEDPAPRPRVHLARFGKRKHPSCSRCQREAGRSRWPSAWHRRGWPMPPGSSRGRPPRRRLRGVSRLHPHALPP